MFSKKPHIDLKKSLQKFLDGKKDTLSRLKHLRVLLETSDSSETKNLFEVNYSHIYYIFYDVFATVDVNLKQRAHKTHKEELDSVRFIFEKILTLLPEYLTQRWQHHSILEILTKFLHTGNSIRLRREGVRLFLLWYQVLGDNAPDEAHHMYITLVPGIVTGIPSQHSVSGVNVGHSVQRGTPTAPETYADISAFYASALSDEAGPVAPCEPSTLLPPQAGEQQPDDTTQFFLECLLDFMVSQVTKIEWKDNVHIKQQRCFQFLFEKFKRHYLLHIFPGLSWSTNLYKPVLDLPQLRQDLFSEPDPSNMLSKNTLWQCQTVFIRWIAKFTHGMKKADHGTTSIPADKRDHLESSCDNKSLSTGTASTSADTETSGSNSTLTFSSSTLPEREMTLPTTSDDYSAREYGIVREILYCSRENVNLVHQVFHQAFLLPFTFSSAIRKVVTVYKDWILMNVPELPLFMLEPTHAEAPQKDEEGMKKSHSSFSGCKDGAVVGMGPGGDVHTTSGRLRNDSYLMAVHLDYSHIRAGRQNVLQVFITNAANIFLLELASDNIPLLEEQVDLCKRVLNVYRYMVMNVFMDRKTWEQLLLVLLQITSQVVKETPPIKKEETLGGRLAPALFQTLIVTWIKANLNVVISSELWDHFLHVLSSLTQWEELIREWAKTMETLTRVLARHVYGLDLNDLPLERPSEQKKIRGMRMSTDGSTKLGGQSSHMEKSRSQYRAHSEELSRTTTEPSGSQSADEDSLQQAAIRIRCSSGEPSRRRATVLGSGLSPASRSSSDSHLWIHRRGMIRRMAKERPTVLHMGYDTDGSHSTEHSDRKNIHRTARPYRSKSLDCLNSRADSPCLSESSEGRSRSPSPTPSSGLESTSIKDSPMQIDMLVSSADNASTCSDMSASGEPRSIMAGGSVRGWLPDVAVVLWRRMLGSLGDINQISDPQIHAQVMDYLVDLSITLLKMRDNLGVTTDNMSSPPPPELIPPLQIIVPWLFQALALPDNYQTGKLLAYKLLCVLASCKHDIPLSHEYLIRFYSTLHHGLVGTDQDVINTIIKHCGLNFFSLGLPGWSLLVMDFIYAADTVASSNGIKGVPRTEALSLLGSLLCVLRVYSDIQALQPSPNEMKLLPCKDAKDHVISILLKAGKKEPAGLARGIALSALGIYLYEEFHYRTNHPRIREAISVLLMALKFNRLVAQVSSDMLLLLTSHSKYLMQVFPDIPRRIVEVMASTLSTLLPGPDRMFEAENEKLILSLMLCLGEWCMHIPELLFSSEWGNGNLVSVFQVLNSAVRGNTISSQAATSATFPDLASPDVDPDIVINDLTEGTSPGSPHSPATGHTFQALRDYVNPKLPPSLDSVRAENVIKLTARSVMSHLINHLGHFPMGIGAARLSSLVNEHDDVPMLTGDGLSADVFNAPNIQFFVLNNCAIISLVEIPALEAPGGGPTAGLTTAESQVRIIVRDLSGKFSWDCSVLYGPPNCRTGSCSLDTKTEAVSQRSSSNSASDSLSENDVNGSNTSSPPVIPPYQSSLSLHGDDSEEELNDLDDLLEYLGNSSPECVLHPGNPLNSAPAAPNEDTNKREGITMNVLLNQSNLEVNHVYKHTSDCSMIAKPVQPPETPDLQSPFHHSHLLLEQLGFLSWEKRPQFDLLKKNERLLREIRNLDNQKCRESHKIAVIYVAEGQEDKNSLMLNSGGSQAFENFVAGLGWEVELETHPGFMGGLHRNKSTGDTAPYYATSFLEVVFHVSTRMPTSWEEDAMTKKLRHLGNDEIHIVWSEHTRDYRRGIIATEFCDVLIVIYPLDNDLYRINICRKPEIPYFGPLFNGAIVDHNVLPGLVRATAINASRAKRSLLPLYQNFYEERAKSLEVIVRNHKEVSTFEQFAANVYAPAPSRTFQLRVIGSSSCSEGASSPIATNLAAALLDSGSSSNFNMSPRNRPVSLSASDRTSPQTSPQTSLRGQRERPLSSSHSPGSSPLSHN